MKRLVFAAALAAFCVGARADSLLLLGASKHFGSNKQYQERNWGVGYERDGLSVGAYRNSHNRVSMFVMKTIWRYQITRDLSFSLPVGVVTGYELPIMPGALPTLSWQATKDVAVDVGIMPGKTTVVGAQLRIALPR